MSTNTTIARPATSRAPDDRFKDAGSANERYSTITKIEVNSFQLDDSFEDNSDPYNSTGRFLVTAVKNQYRE